MGRVGSYAGLRFAEDTIDETRGALMAKVQERATTIATRLVFFELEWAAADRRARRGRAGRRPAGVLRPPPAQLAALPRPPVERARGAGAHRDVGQRRLGVGPAVQRADVGHRDRAAGVAGRRRRRRRRCHRRPRAGSLAAAAPRSRACARLPPRPSRPAWRRGCARGPMCSTPCCSTSRSTIGCGRTRRGSRRGTCPTRPATSRCRRSSTPWSPATTSRSAGTRSRPRCSASTSSPTTTAWRRWPTTRPRSAGRPPRRWCSTPTPASRPSWPRRPGGSSTSTGSTRRCARASDRVRSAPTRCPSTTPTCSSTGPGARATCRPSPTSSATGCTPTSPGNRACSTSRRR